MPPGWYYHTKKQDYARFMGHMWLDLNLLTEDTYWSIELLEDRLALSVLPMALSYGQLPPPPSPARKKAKSDGKKEYCSCEYKI